MICYHDSMPWTHTNGVSPLVAWYNISLPMSRM